MASTAHNEAGIGNSVQLRRRNEQVAYSTPGDVQQYEYNFIAAGGSDALRDDELLVLADSMALMENIITTILYAGYKNVISGRLKANADTQHMARRDLAIIESLHSQYDRIREGRQTFSKLYLENERFLYFWATSHRVIIQFAQAWHDGDEFAQWLERRLEVFDSAAQKAGRQVMAIGERGLINSETKAILRRKWEIIEQITAILHEHKRTQSSVPTWDELSKSIVTTRRDQTKLPSFPIMWLTVVSALCSVPLFAFVYRYSTHETGTLRDADFWSQLQSSIMQTVSSVVAILSLWHKDKVPRWMWLVPTAVALLCAVVAVPLYVLVPTEWSVLASMISTAVQAFVVVQLAFNGVD